MEKLYSPWRQHYVVKSSKKPTAGTSGSCAFCTKLAERKDTENFIIKRYQHSTVFLNLYPYNAGHLMVIPNRHCKDLAQLNPEERNELMEVLNESIAVLNKTIKPDGVNVGINLGKAAGASIVEHLHVHVLPRWEGDTNFLPLLAETKQISVDLKQMYQQLKAGF